MTQFLAFPNQNSHNPMSQNNLIQDFHKTLSKGSEALCCVCSKKYVKKTRIHKYCSKECTVYGSQHPNECSPLTPERQAQLEMDEAGRHLPREREMLQERLLEGQKPSTTLTPKQRYDILSRHVEGFAQLFCKDVLYDKIPDFHMEIYKTVMASERLVMAAPRGFAKSTIAAKIYPLWLALFVKRKDICIISNSEGLAVEHLRYIKTKLETDPRILAFWGDVRSEKWTENHIILKHANGQLVNIRAKGAGGQIRGFRPDCLILDDIETDDSVMSEDQRKKLKDWLFKACLNCLLPGGQMVVIGTILSQLSLLSDLLEMPNGWVKKRYMAYIDGIEEEGKELWPEARSHEWLQQRKREIGSSRFASEYMNDPKSDDSAPIKPDMIKYWEELPKDLGMVIALDPAYSEDDKADYKVAVLVGIDTQNRRYLVDYVRTHEPTGEYMDGVINMYMRHKGNITGVGVPNTGVEKQFFHSFQKKCEERKVFPPIVELKHAFMSSSGGVVRSKKARVTAALQPIFEQGKYYIHANHIEAHEELLTIGDSRWDDVVDAMAYAEQILTPIYFEQVENGESNYGAEASMVGACEGYGIEY